MRGQPNPAEAVDEMTKNDIFHKILKHFQCHFCLQCCEGAAVSVKQEELELLMVENPSVLNYLDENIIQNVFKAPCGLIKGAGCSQYLRRPESCALYPFLYMQNTPVLALCPMGIEILAEMNLYDANKKSSSELNAYSKKELIELQAELKKKYDGMGYPDKQMEVMTLNIDGMEKFLKYLERKSETNHGIIRR